MKRQRVLISTVVTILLVVAVGLTYAQGPEPEPDVKPRAAAGPAASTGLVLSAASLTGEGLSTVASRPLGTGLTYQGRLTDAGGPVDGNCDFIFKLYDEAGSGSPPNGGTLLGTEEKSNRAISDGYFTVQLDFGSGVFTGEARWLEIDVDCGGGAVTLSPRQALTAAPYALYAPSAGAAPWSGISGVPGDLADGDDDTTYSAGAGLSLTDSTFSADTSYLQRRVSGSCASGNAIRVIDEDGTVTCEPVGDGVGPHDHLGETWMGNTPLTISGNFATAPLVLSNGAAGTASVQSPQQGGDGLRIQSAEDDGVQIDSTGDEGAFVVSAGEDGVLIESAGRDAFSAVDAGGDGLYVKKAGDDGVDVREAGDTGVYVASAAHDGVRVEQAGWDGVLVNRALYNGVRVDFAKRGMYVQNAYEEGVYVNRAEGDGVYLGHIDGDGVRVFKAGDGPVPINTEPRTNNGFEVNAAEGVGLFVGRVGGDAVWVYEAGHDGVRVMSAERDGVNVHAERDGVNAIGDRYGVYASTTATNAEYGLYTPDKVFAGRGYDDIAEHIDAASDVEPGDVVVIDPEHDEQVVKSTKPYDTSVAGIISTDPAMLIGRSDTETPLALAGRVPCKVSAENGPIRRGDLLTTSSTPGHAMKATEPQLGTILGKALGELESGTGVIHVLLTLQ